MSSDVLSFWTIVAVVAVVALLALGAWAGMWLGPLAPDVSL